MFTNSSYLKVDNGKQCVGYAITTNFDVVKAEYLPVVTSAQQTKADALQKACTLAKAKLPIFILIVDTLLEQFTILEYYETMLSYFQWK